MANQKTNKNLFAEFPPISTKEWEEKIHIDLKGADYERKLVWRTPEGFKAKPYYRAEDLEGKEYLDTLPGEFPYTRGNKKTSNDWEIRQDIKLDDIQVANQKALFVLDRGITSLGFITGSQKGDTQIKTQEDLTALLKDIIFECIHLNFVCGDNAPEIVQKIHQEAVSKKISLERIIGSVDFDPLGYLAVNGDWNENEEADLNALKELIEFAEANLPSYRVLSINGHFFHNSGATVVQELAYSLSLASEYLNKMTDAGLTVDQVSKHMQVNMGVGTSYFMEIAKVRAARALFAKMIAAFGPNNQNASKIYLHSITSQYNNTVYDPYVNVLRATTESMAAVIGGTDSLTVKPFDLAYRETTKFSGRIARNIQIILKEEAYFGNIVDPSAGSYYIENLTESIMEEAWKLFLEIEEQGGYLAAVKAGYIQDQLEQTAKDRNMKIATRREILLGTNQFPNFDEEISEDIDIHIVFEESEPKGNTVKTIKPYRGAQEFEKLRLATEKHSKRPKAFMLTSGNLTMRKARAAFACNFFACAGYEVIDNLGFANAEEGVKAAKEANADIIVVCSSDDEYAELVPAAAELAKDAIIVVAGAPKCADELKAKGIKHFIHVKSNVLETLQNFHKELGIEL